MTAIRSWKRRRLMAGVVGLAGVGLSIRVDANGAIAPSGDIVLGQTFDARRAELMRISRVQRAFFDSVNARNGVRGRAVRLVTLNDDGDPVRARQNLHELVDRHRVLALFGMPMLAPDDSGAFPQLFVRDRLAPPPGANVVGFYPGPALEGRLVARHIAERMQTPRVAVLRDGDAASEQFMAGLSNGLATTAGAKGGMQIVPMQADLTDAAELEARIRALQAGGANVIVSAVAPSLAIRALAVTRDIGWQPRRVIGSEAALALQMAPERDRAKAAGTESIRFLKDGHDPSWTTLERFHFADFPRWVNDRGIQTYSAFIRHYAADVDVKSEPVEFAYSTAHLMVHVLERCGDRLTRDNVIRQAMRLAGYEPPLLSPGIRVYTHPGRATPISQGQFMRFDGRYWTEFGAVIDADDD